VRRALEPDEVRRRAPPPRLHLGPGDLVRPLREGGLARVAELRDPTVRGLGAALVFGERSGLPHDLIDRFTRTGTRHLLALSGLHVGLVAWLVAGPAAMALATLVGRLSGGRLRPAPELFRAAAALLLVPLGGAGAPVARAALAIALASLAPRLPGPPGRGSRAGRRVDGLSLWSLALLLELLAQPAGVRSPGVQLSYAATLGLLLATGSTLSSLRARLPGEGRLARTSPSGRRRPEVARIGAQRLLDGLGAALVASWVATLATLPIVWGHFGEVSPWGVLLTPLALPFLAAFLCAGWAWVLLPPLCPESLVELPARGLTSLLELADHLPGTPLVLPERPLLLVVAAALCALYAGAGPGRRRSARWAALAGGAALLPWASAPRGLEVWALDVGHGTAVLARAPGEGAWLFDAGSRDRLGTARAALMPLMRRWEVGRLAVVLSHAERDHDGALDWLLERFSAQMAAGPVRSRGARAALHLDIPRGALELPTRGTLSAKLLRGREGNDNEGSRHLELALGGRRVLLCGDAEGPGLAQLIDAGGVRGPLDLLLLPHHGSPSPFLGPLLDAARPAEVWISATGPPAVTPELDRRGILWRATGIQGPLGWCGGLSRVSIE